ncbi:MAG: acyl-CoA dehydrogenase [Pelagibacteraceae bacterium TMED65]|nr:acyl-CoA dehydrogenase [Rickettsiales bacterium]OUU53060.1 MAG: acyl-CoA dehydrogenase [Pelagibacteraceae bacterium TMED65]
MDSSANINSDIINFRKYLVANKDVYALILSNLETVAKKSNKYLVSLLKIDGKLDNNLLETNQFKTHGYAWFETYRIGLRETFNWFNSLEDLEKSSEIDASITIFAFSEYLLQMKNGIMMSQSEVIRPIDIGLQDSDFNFMNDPSVQELIEIGLSDKIKKVIVDSLDKGIHASLGLNDETLDMIQDQFKKFTEEEILPHSNEWHLKDDLIPDETLNKMAELGVFSIAIPESYGGLGMGKVAMCVVTEELSRGFLAAGSLGTRAEIAGELIRLGGTEEQKKKYLPEIASGNLLTTAVFTEPNTGSDLGSLSTRAVLKDDEYTITGNKTWITHGARSDLMTVLARTDSEKKGYKGLSMFLVEKPRGTDENPFPMEGMTGSEIEVLGYRGMKEYEIGLDDIKVNKKQLLGEEEGKGFKQLMETFESARIQTAARAVGVAQNSIELALQYAKDRSQFGKQIIKFPRIFSKLAWMAMETTVARQLTLFSAREKDNDIRCDIEAGMAKLLAARVAWSNADSALQIHGGNGYALEYPISRVLCDSRILNIFEGAAEIQAQIVVKGLLSR